jgi:hypothetical protein
MHHAVSVAGHRVTYAGLFQVVPPENVVQWQPAAGELQKIWVASEHGGPARPAPAAGATPYTGLEQGVGVLCADTDDPHGFADYEAAARLARARSGPFGLRGRALPARTGTPARGTGARPAPSW